MIDYYMCLISGRNRRLQRLEWMWIEKLRDRQTWLDVFHENWPTKRNALIELTNLVRAAKAQITKVRNIAKARGDRIQPVTRMVLESRAAKLRAEKE